MTGLNANDSAFLATLRDEFNAQERGERLRTGRFMTYEAAMELLRERVYVVEALRRIDRRISVILEAERRKVTPGVSTNDAQTFPQQTPIHHHKGQP